MLIDAIILTAVIIVLAAIMTFIYISLLIPYRNERRTAILIAIWIVLSLVCILAMVPTMYERHPVQEETKTYIYSADIVQSSSGRFILGSGIVGSHPVYECYKKGNSGGFTLATIPATGTVIFMDENINPYFITRYTQVVPGGDPYDFSYEMHIPENSIKKEYGMNP